MYMKVGISKKRVFTTFLGMESRIKKTINTFSSVKNIF